ncbi:aspartate 1-decarboxylase [Streptomyces sp. NPDC001093]|uniref:aspartate 1-decarboxylase n=1 Tax=Streptomyces sp. NPDC001093 TaxID=3154376 RepID=UPI003319F1F0
MRTARSNTHEKLPRAGRPRHRYRPRQLVNEGGPEVQAAAKITLPGPADQLREFLQVGHGKRLSTYVIEGPAGSGVIGINGAAARLISPGHPVIIISYADMADAQTRAFVPSVVFVDADNRIVQRGDDPADVPAGFGLLRGDVPANGIRV